MFSLIFSKLLILAADPAIVPSFTAYSSIANQPVGSIDKGDARNAVVVYETFANYLKATDDLMMPFRFIAAGIAYILWVVDETLQWWFFHLFQLFEIQSQGEYGVGHMYNEVCTFGAWLFWAILIIYVLASMVNNAAGRRYKNILRNMVIIFAFVFMFPKVGQDFGTGISKISLSMGSDSNIGNYATQAFQYNVVSIPHKLMLSHPGRNLLADTSSKSVVAQKNNRDKGVPYGVYPVILNLERMPASTRQSFNGMSDMSIGQFVKGYYSNNDTLNPSGLKNVKSTFDNMIKWAQQNTPDIENGDSGWAKFVNRVEHPEESTESFIHSALHPISKEQAQSEENAHAPMIDMLQYYLGTDNDHTEIQEWSSFTKETSLSQAIWRSYGYYHVDWIGVYTQLIMILLIMIMFIAKLFTALFKLVVMYVTTGFILAVNGANHSKVKSWIFNIFSIYEVAIVDLLSMYAVLQLVPFMRTAINDISTQTGNFMMRNQIMLNLIYALACFGIFRVAKGGLNSLDAQIGPSGGGANSGAAGAWNALAGLHIAHMAGKGAAAPFKGAQALVGRRPKDKNGSVANRFASRHRGQPNPLRRHSDRKKNDKNKDHANAIATGSRSMGHKMTKAQDKKANSWTKMGKHHQQNKLNKLRRKHQKSSGDKNQHYNHVDSRVRQAQQYQQESERRGTFASPTDDSTDSGLQETREQRLGDGPAQDDSTSGDIGTSQNDDDADVDNEGIDPTDDTGTDDTGTGPVPDFRDSGDTGLDNTGGSNDNSDIGDSGLVDSGSGSDYGSSRIANDADRYTQPGESAAHASLRTGKSLVQMSNDEKGRVIAGREPKVPRNTTALHAAVQNGVQVDSNGNRKYTSKANKAKGRVNPKFKQERVSRFVLTPGAQRKAQRAGAQSNNANNNIVSYVPAAEAQAMSIDNDTASSDGGGTPPTPPTAPNGSSINGITTFGTNTGDIDGTGSANTVHNTPGHSHVVGQSGITSNTSGTDTTVQHNQDIRYVSDQSSNNSGKQYRHQNVTDNVAARQNGQTQNGQSHQNLANGKGQHIVTNGNSLTNRMQNKTGLGQASSRPGNTKPTNNKLNGQNGQTRTQVHDTQGSATVIGNNPGQNTSRTNILTRRHNQNVSNSGNNQNTNGTTHSSRTVTDNVNNRQMNPQQQTTGSIQNSTQRGSNRTVMSTGSGSGSRTIVQNRNATDYKPGAINTGHSGNPATKTVENETRNVQGSTQHNGGYSGDNTIHQKNTDTIVHNSTVNEPSNSGQSHTMHTNNQQTVNDTVNGKSQPQQGQPRYLFSGNGPTPTNGGNVANNNGGSNIQTDSGGNSYDDNFKTDTNPSHRRGPDLRQNNLGPNHKY